MALVDNIRTQVNKYVRNYAVESFHDMRLNAILNMILDLLSTISGGVVATSTIIAVTSADFTNATDCPLPSLNGRNIAIFFNEGNKFIIKSAGEWSDLAGGGFRVGIPGFDATTGTFHFFVYPL